MNHALGRAPTELRSEGPRLWGGRRAADTFSGLRICFVYDRLPPHTVGGAEEWYRNLAERLAEEGHDVTYLTMRHWDKGVAHGVRGVRVVAFGPKIEPYTADRRSMIPPLIFGFGVLRHLLRHGRRYDVVHSASFPYFSLLAAGLVRPLWRFGLVVDWHELWTRDYWLRYLGPVGGRIGWAVQRACLGIPQRAFCFSRVYERRLREQGFDGPVTVLRGQYAGPLPGLAEAADPPVVVFAGRHIPEKRVPALVPAIALARQTVPELRCEIFGDGADREEVLRLIAEERLDDAVDAPGYVDRSRIEQALSRALCLVLPSRREGYGLVVVEAAAYGTPSVVVSDADNAAVELIEEGVNGFIAPTAGPGDLAEAIVRVAQGAAELRRATAEWFAAHRDELSLNGSLEHVLSVYARPAPAPDAPQR
jgi:glycosyltransferase involved in cell wall biosynthesis